MIAKKNYQHPLCAFDLDTEFSPLMEASFTIAPETQVVGGKGGWSRGTHSIWDDDDDEESDV